MANLNRRYPPQGTAPWADNNPKPRLTFSFHGGLNENTDPDIAECSEGYNFTLGVNQRSFIPREPIDLRGTATNGGAINSFMQLTTRAAVRTTLVQAGTTVYLWDGAASFTSKGTVTSGAFCRDVYWSLGDYLVISDVNLLQVMQKWDGTTLSTMTHTGISGSLYAKFAVVHLNRVWLFNIKIDSTSYPHMIIACAFEDPTNWDNATRGGLPDDGGDTGLTTGLEAFYLFSPDLKEINAACFFQNALIVSTKDGKIFKLEGTNSKDFKFVDFFNTEPAIGVGQLAPIGNDVLYLRRGGSIVQLLSTQSFGNVNIANLSQWIPTTTNNLATIKAIVYDINKQRVFIFISNKVLVLFKDILNSDRFSVARNASASSNLSPWSVYVTDDSSNFNTNCGAYIIDPGTTEYNVFFGDSAGRIFAMYGSGVGDAGSIPIRALRRSIHIGPEELSPWPWTQENLTGHLIYSRNTQADVTVSVEWDDEYAVSGSVVTLKGPLGADTAWYWNGDMYFGGAFYFNQGFQGTGKISSINLTPGGKGPGFFLSVSTPFSQPFEILSIQFD